MCKLGTSTGYKKAYLANVCCFVEIFAIYGLPRLDYGRQIHQLKKTLLSHLFACNSINTALVKQFNFLKTSTHAKREQRCRQTCQKGLTSQYTLLN